MHNPYFNRKKTNKEKLFTVLKAMTLPFLYLLTFTFNTLFDGHKATKK